MDDPLSAITINQQLYSGQDGNSRRIGPFEFGPLLSSDDLSSTYLATHVTDGSLVAIRVVDLELRFNTNLWSPQPQAAAAVAQSQSPDWFQSKEVLQYFASLKRLCHPHIVPLKRIYRTPKRLFLVSDFLRGGPVMNAVRARWVLYNSMLHRAAGEVAAGGAQLGSPSPSPSSTVGASTKWFYENKMSEEEGRFYFQQLVCAIRFAHEKGDIFHGALSLDCLWIDGPLPMDASSSTIHKQSYAQRPKLAIANFGTSLLRSHSKLADQFLSSLLDMRKHSEGDVDRSNEIVERLACIAPELLVVTKEIPPREAKDQTSSLPQVVPLPEDAMKKADVWSLGVILFAMLAGYFPFFPSRDSSADNLFAAAEAQQDKRPVGSSQISNATERDIALMLSRAASAEFSFPSHFSRGVRGVRHLIASMLAPDPAKRYSLDQVIAHPWFDIRLERQLLSQ